jgi:poly(hydroxyalkanoate) depolymerase family esterase
MLRSRARTGLTVLALVAAPRGAIAISPVTSFGSNPGNLNMYEHIPANIMPHAPLVVTLHGCDDTMPPAADFAAVSGFLQLANDHGFALALPEQQSANNTRSCFNWFLPGVVPPYATEDETTSIKEMVDYMLAHHDIDRSRIYVAGFSAGAAMAIAVLASHPDVFAGGGSMAGVAYGCATDLNSANTCLSSGMSMTPMQWGDLVRAASSYTGPWPIVSIWQGRADQTVNPVNADAIRMQWTNVHGLGETPSTTMMLANGNYSAWKDGQGRVQVELYEFTGVDHTIEILPGNGEGQCGMTSSTLPTANVGLCAAYQMAKTWGLITLSPSMDGGGTTMDGGSTTTDGGGMIDATSPSDAGGGSPDGAAALDGSAAPDASSMSPGDAGSASDADSGGSTLITTNAKPGGCGCGIAHEPTPSDLPIAIILFVAPAFGVLRRRR